jgi:hypothetical protein
MMEYRRLGRSGLRGTYVSNHFNTSNWMKG